MDSPEGNGSSRVEARLSPGQQSVLRSKLIRWALELPGVVDAVEAIAAECLGQLTPDTSLSDVISHQLLESEAAKCLDNPAEYLARSRAAEYIGLTSGASEAPDLSGVSPDLAAYVTPADIPRQAEEFKDWWGFAVELDGYEVADRLGTHLQELEAGMREHYKKSGRWCGSLLDLRLALYMQARKIMHWGAMDMYEVGADTRREIEDLLAAMVAVRST